MSENLLLFFSFQICEIKKKSAALSTETGALSSPFYRSSRFTPDEMQPTFEKKNYVHLKTNQERISEGKNKRKNRKPTNTDYNRKDAASTLSNEESNQSP